MTTSVACAEGGRCLYVYPRAEYTPQSSSTFQLIKGTSSKQFLWLFTKDCARTERQKTLLQVVAQRCGSGFDFALHVSVLSNSGIGT